MKHLVDCRVVQAKEAFGMVGVFLAAAEQNKVVATALTAQINAAATRPTIAERAQSANWQKVDDILTHVPANPPVRADERE